jgi:hypothetical protein
MGGARCPGFVFLPLIFIVPTVYTSTAKAFFLTTCHFQLLGKPRNVIITLLTLVIQYGFYGCCHYWLYRIIVMKLRFRSIFLDLYFITMYVVDAFLTIYDFEYARNNLQHCYLSDLNSYVIPPIDFFHDPVGHIKGVPIEADIITGIVFGTIQNAPRYWKALFTFLVLFFLVCFILLWRYRMAFVGALKRRPAAGLGYVDFRSPQLPKNNEALLGEAENDEPLSEGLDRILIAYHICAVAYVIWMVWLVGAFRFDKIKFGSMMTYMDMTMMVSAQFEKKIPKRYHEKVVNITRRYLPPGRYWLDTREDPVFPVVHGDKTAFCAYNAQDPVCSQKVEAKKPILEMNEMPNFVLLIIESLNPSTYLIDDNFLDETARTKKGSAKYFVSDSPFYHPYYARHLRELAKDGVTFPGMNSHGIPTCSGWHTLMTGLTPAQNYMNMIEGIYLQVDDIPSHMRDEGFWSFYLSAEDFEFDGMRNWVWRKNATHEAKTRLQCAELLDLDNDPILKDMLKEQELGLKNCTVPEMRVRVEKLEKQLAIQDFPLWFDYAEMYFPSAHQAEIMNISNKTLSFRSWVCDRVSSAEFRLHWNQQRDIMDKNKIRKPIFGGYMNVESHMPYLGYDKDDQYEKMDLKADATMDDVKKARYLRVNKYADEHAIGSTIAFLRKHEPNTIVFLTGDHGTRDIPIRWKNTNVTNQTVYSGDCVGGSSGGDSIFTTTGVIAYLGEDERVKKAMGLDRLKGKSVKFATDHNDMIYTMFDLLANLQGREMKPTHRRGRNLLNVSLQILGKTFDEQARILNSSKWQSLSFISHQFDYRRGSETLRFHPADPEGAHYYDAVVFPTCLKARDDPEMPVGVASDFPMYRESFEFLTSENYLTSWNRVYSYKFRDDECIAKGNCTMPQPGPDVRASQKAFFVYYIVLPVPAMLGIGGFLVLAYEMFQLFFGPKDEAEEALLDRDEDGLLASLTVSTADGKVM